jgi:hypothetical protein
MSICYKRELYVLTTAGGRNGKVNELGGGEDMAFGDRKRRANLDGMETFCEGPL